MGGCMGVVATAAVSLFDRGMYECLREGFLERSMAVDAELPRCSRFQFVLEGIVLAIGHGHHQGQGKAAGYER